MPQIAAQRSLGAAPTADDRNLPHKSTQRWTVPTKRLRSITDGKVFTVALESPREMLRDRSIRSALADVVFKIVINNGSTIALDNQLTVDSFILFYFFY